MNRAIHAALLVGMGAASAQAQDCPGGVCKRPAATVTSTTATPPTSSAPPIYVSPTTSVALARQFAQVEVAEKPKGLLGRIVDRVRNRRCR